MEAMLANLPDRPPYFGRSVMINLRGAPCLTDCPVAAPLRLTEFNALKKKALPSWMYARRHFLVTDMPVIA